MEISVQNLWITYFVSLVVLALIGAFIVNKSGSKSYACAVLIAAILSALIVYLVAYYNVDMETLSAQDKSSLQALYLSGLVIIILAFIWCVVELAVRSSKSVKEKVEAHLKVDCVENDEGKEECHVSSLKTVTKDKDGKTVEKVECDEEGMCSPSSFFMKTKDNDTISIRYFA